MSIETKHVMLNACSYLLSIGNLIQYDLNSIL